MAEPLAVSWLKGPDEGVPGVLDRSDWVAGVEGEVKIHLLLGGCCLLPLQLVPLLLGLGGVGLGIVDGLDDEGLDLVQVIAAV